MEKEDKAEKRRIYAREYYEKNKEKISNKAKERYLRKSEDKVERTRIHGQEYHEKNKEKISQKARERYLQNKEEKGIIDKPSGRPRKYENSDDQTKKEIAEDYRVQNYIRRIKNGEDINIENMSMLQRRDLAIVWLELENEKYEHQRKEIKIRRARKLLLKFQQENPSEI